jgi:hypothetical protein
MQLPAWLADFSTSAASETIEQGLNKEELL